MPEGGTGSSPHARGTRNLNRSRIGLLRFIPACAGNTPATDAVIAPLPVHPRMRGEHMGEISWPTVLAGSSPHARGTPGVSAGNHPAARFIPACAGNTAPHLRQVMGVPVHPRMRGEHYNVTPGLRIGGGSSPHARGTQEELFKAYYNARFIPACAGNTSVQKHHSPPNPVHPRMRGEHVIIRASTIQGSGSSPHARGTLCVGSPAVACWRFIPACAGNTASTACTW